MVKVKLGRAKLHLSRASARKKWMASLRGAGRVGGSGRRRLSLFSLAPGSGDGRVIFLMD